MAAHRIVAYSLLSTGDTWTLLRKGDVRIKETVDVESVIRSNNGDTCPQAAIPGLGIVLQPDFLVRQYVDRGELLELLPAWQADEFGIYAVWLSVSASH